MLEDFGPRRSKADLGPSLSMIFGLLGDILVGLVCGLAGLSYGLATALFPDFKFDFSF